MKINSSFNNRNQEVVIAANPDQLRVLANWLNKKADEMEKEHFQFDHAHVKLEVDKWHKNWPDVIIQNPKTIG